MQILSVDTAKDVIDMAFFSTMSNRSKPDFG